MPREKEQPFRSLILASPLEPTTRKRYAVFSTELPLRLCIGLWLTDLPHAGMGNFIYMPGSHRNQDFEQYYTHESVPGEVPLVVPAGTMTVMHCGTWHRVDVNKTDVIRKNIFVSHNVPAERGAWRL